MNFVPAPSEGAPRFLISLFTCGTERKESDEAQKMSANIKNGVILSITIVRNRRKPSISVIYSYSNVT